MSLVLRGGERANVRMSHTQGIRNRRCGTLQLGLSGSLTSLCLEGFLLSDVRGRGAKREISGSPSCRRCGLHIAVALLRGHRPGSLTAVLPSFPPFWDPQGSLATEVKRTKSNQREAKQTKASEAKRSKTTQNKNAKQNRANPSKPEKPWINAMQSKANTAKQSKSKHTKNTAK